MKATLKTRIFQTALLSVFFFAFQSFSFAQGSKPHYVVNNAGTETAKYYQLLDNFNFDQYRLLDKRRTVKFMNSAITVDLYSAQELKDTYQKAISPLTIMDNTIKNDIIFLMNGGKVQIVPLKK